MMNQPLYSVNLILYVIMYAVWWWIIGIGSHEYFLLITTKHLCAWNISLSEHQTYFYVAHLCFNPQIYRTNKSYWVTGFVSNMADMQYLSSACVMDYVQRVWLCQKRILSF